MPVGTENISLEVWIKMTEKTFYKITNKQIFEKICAIESHLKDLNGSVKSNSNNVKRLWWLMGILLSLGATAFAALR